jgi:signal transduction histidine kinase
MSNVAANEARSESSDPEAMLLALERKVQAADRLRDDFLAIVVHGLRTPLNTILMSAQLLQLRKSGDSEVGEAAGIIIDAVKTLSRLIEEQTEIARIVAGHVDLKCRTMDLAEAAESALAAMAPLAAERGVIVDPPALEQPALLMADPGRVGRVLKNLLSNAVEYTPSGGKVRLSVHRSGDRVVLVVSDTGRGLAPEVLATLFDPSRAREAPSARPRRTLGLGLVVVQRLVEAHGGSVQAASDGPGRGATFTVTLPAAGPAPARNPT